MRLWPKKNFFLQWYIFPKKYNFFYIAPMYLSSTIFQHYKLISSHFHPKYALRPYFQILTQSPRKCPKCQENPFRPHGHTQRIFHLNVIFTERGWHSNLTLFGPAYFGVLGIPLNIFGLGGVRAPILFENDLLWGIYHIQKDSWSLDAQNPPKKLSTLETIVCQRGVWSGS